MAWNWRVPDRAANERLNLRYEPGSLGDLLKGLWALECVRARLERGTCARFEYLDPFAGAPSYPLVPAAQDRLAQFAPSAFHELQKPFFAKQELLSTAGLVAAACAEKKTPAHLNVFEADPKRREAWIQHAEKNSVTWLEGTSGEVALSLALAVAEKSGPRPDLVLVDPYDFLKGGDWKDWFTLLIQAARMAPTLIYVFNRAPRSAGHWNNYRDMRVSLERALPPECGWLCGRVPSDAVLPRAWHEMILLGPKAEVSALRPNLEKMTRDLTSRLAGDGAFEA